MHPGFYLYTSNHLEQLAARLAETVARAPLDPFTPEVILVQSMGMSRWLSLQLATRLGVGANISFPFPNAFVHRVFSLFTDTPPDAAAYSPSTLSWRLAALLPTVIDEPAFADIRSYLDHDLRGVKAFQLCRKLADLFDQYLVFRPDWIAAWREGSHTGIADKQDEQWQRRLFTLLANQIGLPTRADLRREFLQRVRDTAARPPMLQPRISVFGISHMPPFHLEVLAALRDIIQVNIFALNPCGELWDDIVSKREADRLSAKAPGGISNDAPLHLEEGNSLLASMGRHGRDFFRLLHELDPTDADHCSCPNDTDTMLAQVQNDILTLRNPPPTPLPHDPSDRSIRFLSCHSPMREVEVLKDNILHLLDTHDDIDCHDIAVMAPNIEQYVPLVEAVFARHGGNDTALPYSIADRTLSDNRTVADFLEILHLPTGRFRASHILRLLDSQPLRNRFGIDDADMGVIREWIEQLRIRWGVDKAQRATYGIPGSSENTWRAGIDRLLLGYALRGENELFGDVLPFEAGAAHGDTLDKLLGFFESLVGILAILDQEHTATQWAEFLEHILDTLFTFDDTMRHEESELRAAARELSELAATAGFDECFGADVVRELLEQRLSRSSREHGYLSHGITFCSMLPMRSIPFECLFLLGMNDADFPRREVRGSFDLMPRNPRRGDRELRLDDRYQFLEALLSARRSFTVSYVGQDIQDNSSKPPSVCVLELRDYLGRRFQCPTSPPCTVKHRLQPFHPCYFDQGDAEFFSYSRENLHVARALATDSCAEPPVFADAPLAPGVPTTQLGLDQLIRFFANPSQAFLREQPGIEFPTVVETEEDTEAFTLGGLERYALAATLTEGALARCHPDTLRHIARARGLLPHGTVGDIAFERLASDVERFAGLTSRLHGERPLTRVDIDVPIGSVRLSARLSLLDSRDIVLARYARLKALDRIRGWLTHLLLCAHTPDTPPRTTLVARVDTGVFVTCTYAPVPAPEQHLAALLAMREQGHLSPLPFFPETSLAYAKAFVEGKGTEKALAAAHEAWSGQYGANEGSNPSFTQCFGDSLPAHAAFQETALRFFEPLLSAEHEEQL